MKFLVNIVLFIFITFLSTPTLIGMIDEKSVTYTLFNKVLVGNPPRKTYNGQYFNFDFDVKQGLVAFFMPELKIPQGALVKGNYQGATNDLVLDADAPYIKYIMTKQEELTEAEKFLAETDEHYKPELKKTIDSAMVDSLRLRVNTANLEQQVLASVKRAEYNKKATTIQIIAFPFDYIILPSKYL